MRISDWSSDVCSSDLGIRASLESAQERKRTADAIVDSIVADDIGKLPDSNTTEALQRISGIQISRDRGEGGSVAIRGLTQVLTTMNGRDRKSTRLNSSH